MKNAMLKNAFAEMKKTKSRFLSIFGIIAIGAGFFAGLLQSAPAMKVSSDHYYDRTSLSDIRLVSTYGFDDNDIDALKKGLPDVDVYPGYFTDAYVNTDSGEKKVARVYSLDKTGENNPYSSLQIVDGRLPEKENECVIDSGKLLAHYKVGDKLTLCGDEDTDIDGTLSVKEFTIVGKFASPMYISDAERGNTTIGSGSVYMICYIPESCFKTEVYTQVMINSDELKQYSCYSDEYEDARDALEKKIQKIADVREEERFDEIAGDAKKELDDGQKELDKKKSEAYAEIEKNEKKLSDAKKQLDEAKPQLESGKKTLDESKKQLDADTETLLTIGRKKLCQFSVLKFQQMDGMNTALPIGVRKIDSMRTLTTESLGSLIPFRTQEVMDKGGIYCGINAISHNLILVNRGLLLNPSAFILGVPGSGKSMLTKMFILLIILSTSKDQVLVYDPEGEYEPLVQALGGVSLPICAGSDIHLNAMDMVKGYGDKNPVVDKSQFVLSLYERITDDRYVIGPKEKSILDRCVERVYSRKRQYEIPTFFTLRRVLQEQDEPEAKDLALMLELFTDGTLNNFSHPTNIETENRLISFNTRGMVEDMKDLGQLVITDHMINRVSQNWENGVRTHIFLDEFHTLLQHKYSANFFDSAYRRFRKRNAWTTSLTQNVEYVLDSLTARTMLSNSEFIVMLNQAASDRAKLAKLLNISNEQMSYVTNADAGCGLIRYGSALVPFINRFPRDTKLYALMTTKPGEGVFGGEEVPA